MTNIYVGNLAFDASEDDIRQAFAQFGEVSAVNLIMDRETNRPRGFAFVEMPSAEDAKKAIEGMNLKQISGRAVTVNEARPKNDRPKSSGSAGSRARW